MSILFIIIEAHQSLKGYMGPICKYYVLITVVIGPQARVTLKFWTR